MDVHRVPSSPSRSPSSEQALSDVATWASVTPPRRAEEASPWPSSAALDVAIELQQRVASPEPTESPPPRRLSGYLQDPMYFAPRVAVTPLGLLPPKHLGDPSAVLLTFAAAEDAPPSALPTLVAPHAVAALFRQGRSTRKGAADLIPPALTQRSAARQRLFRTSDGLGLAHVPLQPLPTPPRSVYEASIDGASSVESEWTDARLCATPTLADSDPPTPRGVKEAPKEKQCAPCGAMCGMLTCTAYVALYSCCGTLLRLLPQNVVLYLLQCLHPFSQ